MNREQMHQRFQVLWDKVDSEAYPEVQPEQVFDFINQVIGSWCREARKLFETSSEQTDYTQPLVVDGYIDNVELAPSSEAIFPLTAFKDSERGELVKYRYLIALKYADCEVDGKLGVLYIKEQTHNERSTNLRNPHKEPKPDLCYYTLASNQLKVDILPSFKVGRLRLTIIRNPATVSKSQDCDLPESLHELLIQEAVDLCRSSIQPNT